MSAKTLPDLSRQMRKIDITMLATHTEDGEIAARPMSNNGDVEYDGNSYYFTWAKSRMVSDIKRDPKVLLSFTGKKGLFVAVQGEAKVIRDRKKFAEHWNSGDALLKRIEWATTIGRSVGDRIDAVARIDEVLGDIAAEPTRNAVRRAESGAQAIALLLSAPEFQRR